MYEEDSIENYFSALCRIVIDQYNYILEGMSDEEMTEYANNKIHEADLDVKLGIPFGNMARFPIRGTTSRDIIIDHKEFEVETKYWRNWKGGVKGESTAKATWKNSFQSAMDWLCNEIAIGNKGKRTMIAGWSTIFGWNKLLQLGASVGQNPSINKDRIQMLPFLICENGKLDTVRTLYTLKESTFRIPGSDSIINWRLIGKENDKFNMVIYW